MRGGYRLTGDRYRLGRGPVWKHNVPRGLDLPFCRFRAGRLSGTLWHLGLVHIFLQKVPLATWETFAADAFAFGCHLFGRVFHIVRWATYLKNVSSLATFWYFMRLPDWGFGYA